MQRPTQTNASYTAVGGSNPPPDRYFRHRVTSFLQTCHVACRNFKLLFSMPVCVYRAHSISDAVGRHPAYWFHFQRSNSPRTTGCLKTLVTMHGASQPKFFNSLRADNCQIRHKKKIHVLNHRKHTSCLLQSPIDQ